MDDTSPAQASRKRGTVRYRGEGLEGRVVDRKEKTPADGDTENQTKGTYMAKQISIKLPADAKYQNWFPVAIHIGQVPTARSTAAAVPSPNADGLSYWGRAIPGRKDPRLKSLFQTIQTSEMPQPYPAGKQL
jgi:hypothetical protein